MIATAKSQPLYEKYRPTTLQQVVGLPTVCRRIQALVDRGIGGKAVLLTGASGCGKTTLSRIVARAIADDDFPGNVQELDATTLTVADIETLEGEFVHFGFPGKRGLCGRAVIVNEVHGLRKDTLRTLLVVLERIPSHVVWLFTTTTSGANDLFEQKDDAGPFTGRCIPFDLSVDETVQRRAFAQRAKEIAEAEGLGGAGLDAYRIALARRNYSLRAVLNDVEAGSFLV